MSHLLEGIAVVVFDDQIGEITEGLPARGTGLRWRELVTGMADAYDARFGAT